MAKITLNSLASMKQSGEKITMLTAYDATMAYIASNNGMDILLVGDSLGMVCQGESTTVPVTVEEMCYHTRCVSKASHGALVLSDLPFGSCATEDQTLSNAIKLMQAGAEMVKLEGERWLAPVVTRLRQQGIPTCVHMGLTPQSVNVFGGYKVQGRDLAQANMMIASAIELEAAGAGMLVLECIPATLAKEVTHSVSIPVVGIGAGPDTDGQVLVIYDMLNLTAGKPLRFVKNYMADAPTPQEAIRLYADEVKSGCFPAPEHCFD